MKLLWIFLGLLMAVIARSGWGDIVNRKYLPTQSANHGDHFSVEHPITSMKHFYFYQAPEEPTPMHQHFTAPPKPQKNTKIIFIKVPHYKIIPEVIAPPSPSANDRTILYILSKQPEDAYVTIPASFGIQPTKPEVYFIKYDNKKGVLMHPQHGLYAQQMSTNIPSLQNGNRFITYSHNVQRGQERAYITQRNLVPNQSPAAYPASVWI